MAEARGTTGRLGLSWSQSILDHSSTSQEQPTQEVLTQNADLTQLCDDLDEDEALSPLPPYSPTTPMPWARLMPCSRNYPQGIDLWPRPVEEQRPGAVFNEYRLGRSNKCDVVVEKPKPLADAKEQTRREWVYGMVSNKHCRIYCLLTGDGATEVYLEDTSGNGTLINKSTLLSRGERRLLHSGDEICLVNPATIRKKIRSTAAMQELLTEHSYVFVNVTQQQASLHAAVMGRVPRPRHSAGSARKTAVDVRGTASKFPPPPPRASLGRRISPRRQSPRKIELDYDLRDVLGSGTVGEVRRAIDRKTGRERAVKIIKTKPMMGQANAAFEAEASILRELDNPYVVKLIDYYVSPTAVYLVMELLQGGDLFDRIVKKGRYSECDARRVMRRLLSAVFYLHEERQVVHRDLKPENILLQGQSDVDIQVTDFGLAKTIGGEGLKTMCGTPMYISPEVLARRGTVMGRGRYGKPADMWSLGIILYVLLSGTPPYDDTTDQNLSRVSFPDEYWEGISSEARDLVGKLLVTDPRARLTVRGACNHPWINADDGDTHVHPLDDPKLPVSQKRLFPAPQPVVKEAIMDGASDGCAETDQVVDESLAPMPTDAAMSLDDQGGKPAAVAMPSDKMVESPLGSAEPVGDATVSESGDASITVSESGDAKARDPLSDVSLNDVAVASSPLEVVPVKSEVEAPVDHSDRTPSASNRTTPLADSDEPPKADLSDDEICSQFSEKTESISSFSTVDAGALHKNDEGADTDDAAQEDDSTMTVEVVRPKTRRVTESVGRRPLSPNTTLKSGNATKKKKQKTSAKPKTVVANKKEDRSKQTTLSNWFTKHN